MDQKHSATMSAPNTERDNPATVGVSESAKALVRSHFAAAANNAMQASQQLGSDIVYCAETIIAAFLSNHKLMVFGDTQSNADAAYLVARLTGELEQSRPPLPALQVKETYGDDGATGAHDSATVRQIRALGNPGDVMMILSTRGEAPNVAGVIRAAREREMRLAMLLGCGGGMARTLGAADDVMILIDEQRIIRILELQRVAIHAMCDVIDSLLLGDG
jgi:D-sedoheptulose 7-phosphate isomerase